MTHSNGSTTKITTYPLKIPRVNDVYLEYDLAFQLCGRRQLLGQLLDGLHEEFVSKHLLEDTSHLTLLI